MKQNTFEQIVRDHFQFVEQYGFTCAATSTSDVRYESKAVYISVSHEERDGEVGISFGRLGTNEDYSFTLFLRKRNPVLEKRLGERLATTPDEIRDCVSKLSYALQNEGADILIGKDVVFEEMKNIRWWHFWPEALKRS